MQTIKEKASYGSDRILLIDDEEFCISSMRAIMFKLGLDIENKLDYCMNGAEACELAEFALKHHLSYKIIFTDFNMPVMNGIETAARMREIFENHEQPVIVGVTGYASSKYH
jgi:CheY-like chemotaxis protein